MTFFRKAGTHLVPRLRVLCARTTETLQLGSLPFGARYFADQSLLKTPLHDFHVEQGGKSYRGGKLLRAALASKFSQYDFCMPGTKSRQVMQYKDSIMEATLHCRENASLFDVSHMCGLTLKGKDAVPFLESLVVGDIQGVENGSGTLSVFTNEKGGIIDDSVITKVGDDEVYLVVNAGCREKDLAHISKYLEKFTGSGKKVDMQVHNDRSLLALQGPAAMEVLQPHVDFDLSRFYFSNFTRVDIAGIPCFLTRTGYTGEDGFEISAPDEKALELTKKLLENERVRMCGLGPRDSLRLEAGLCLYGNDLNEDTTPIQAGLKWTIGKNRRDKCDFLGGEIIKKQMDEGVDVRRVGFVSGGAPARQHTKIVTQDGEEVGEITSGAFSPCLKKNVAMGYVKKPHDKSGNKLKLIVRGRENEAEITKMPFVKTTYFKPS